METAVAHPTVAFTKQAKLDFSDMQADQYSLQQIIGQDTVRFSNIAYVSNDMFLYVSGNALYSMSTSTGLTAPIQQNCEGGVMCVCGTSDASLVAVGYAGATTSYFKVFKVVSEQEDGAVQLSPGVFLKETVCRDTEQLGGVDAIQFSNESDLVALVTTAPEYLLMVYSVDGDLKLKARAYSNSVMRIHFTEFDSKGILTGGKSHFKQWSMERTFTGKKLKGELAKFGLLDATDTVAFVEFPSGNYLSGQGGGEIALWDQTNVRIIFKGCHAGAIELMQIERSGLFYQGEAGQQLRKAVEERCAPGDNWRSVDAPVLITGGADGYLRFWSAQEIMNAQYVERETQSIYFDVRPIKEVHLGDKVCVRNWAVSPDRHSVVIQDAYSGGFLIMDTVSLQVQRMSCGFGGPVSSITFCNSSSNIILANDQANKNEVRSGLLAAVGQSGNLIVADVCTRRVVDVVFSAQRGATVVQFLLNGLLLAVGFTDGTVRFYSVLPECSDAGASENQLVYLIAAHKCFTASITGFSCSPSGVLAVLCEDSHVFLFRLQVCLVRREDLAEKTQHGQVSSLGETLVQVVTDQQNVNAASRQAAEIARRNARGKMGVTCQGIQPLGFFDASEGERLENMAFLGEEQLLFTVTGVTRVQKRLCVVTLPSPDAIQAYRNSSPEQTLQSTLQGPGEEQASLISFDITCLVPEKRYIAVAIPPQKVPARLEKTVAKIEFDAVSEKVRAMLPAKNVVDSLQGMLDEPQKPGDSKEEEEDENPDDPEGLGLGGEKDKPKKKKKKLNDPLEEDDAPLMFDFLQFRPVCATGFTPNQLDQIQFQALIKVQIPQEIETRAHNAMEVVRARAEAAAAGQSVPSSMQEDPATLCAALAVAQVRAAFRENLLYVFSLRDIIAQQTVQPMATAQIGVDKFINHNLLDERECDDEKFHPGITEPCQIVARRPIACYALAEQKLFKLVDDDTQKRAMENIYQQQYQPQASVVAALEGGVLSYQPFDAQEDYDQLQNISAGVKRQIRYLQFQIAQKIPTQSLTTLEVGLGGHCVALGDCSGNLYIFTTRIFDQFVKFRQRNEPMYTGRGYQISHKYSPDLMWSTSMDGMQVRRLPFKDEVFNLVPKTVKIGKGVMNQLPIEVDDAILKHTVEELRLLSLDQADNKRGLTQRQVLQNKVKQLKDREQILRKKNEQQPVGRRLNLDEIAPDLLLSQIWLSREEQRARDLVQMEVGELLNQTVRQIQQVELIFSQQDVLSVKQFGKGCASVQSFKQVPLPADFQQQLEAVGADDPEAIENQNDALGSQQQPNSIADMSGSQDTPTHEHSGPGKPKTERLQSARSARAAPVPLTKIKALRPVDKIVQQVLGGFKEEKDDTPIEEKKKQRVLERQAAREARQRELRSLEEKAKLAEQTDPVDARIIALAQNTIGQFVFKQDANYVEMITRMAEEQERSSGLKIPVNPSENREGKWRNYLLTMKAFYGKKEAFNRKVSLLFQTKIAVVRTVQRLAQQAELLSALIKTKLGQPLAAEIDLILKQTQEDPEEIIELVCLTREEQRQYTKTLMRQQWEHFLAQRKDETFHLGAVFDPTVARPIVAEFIESARAEGLITHDEAQRLRELSEEEFVDLREAQREGVLRYVVRKTAELESGQTSTVMQEYATTVSGYGETEVFSAQVRQTDQGVIPQNPGFDTGRLINLFSRVQISAQRAEDVIWAFRLLLHARQEVFSKIAGLLRAFDDSVQQLLSTQVSLQAEFCRIRTRQVAYFQEAEIHHTYVTKDRECLGKLEQARGEHKEIASQQEKLLTEVRQKAEQAREVCSSLQELQVKFDQQVAKDAAYRMKLYKLYNRRLKKLRQKKKLPLQDQENPTPSQQDAWADSDEESSRLSDASDAEDDEEIDETRPPEGVTQELFDAVLTLREQKRALDAQLGVIEQQAEGLKAQAANLSKKEKGILTNKAAAQQELTGFRAQKQQELNNVQTNAVVTLQQYAALRPLEAGEPTGSVRILQVDLGQSLLFSTKMLDRLHNRQRRREQEIAGLVVTQRELREAEKRQRYEKKLCLLDYEEAAHRLSEIQKLKFGRQVQIERLDAVSVNDAVSEMQRAMETEERRHGSVLEAAERQMQTELEMISQLRRENTRLVEQLSKLEQRGLKLDQAIVQRQRQPPKAWCSDNRQELVRQEYNNLKQAIVDRERELRSLVDEIAVLKNHTQQK